MLLDTFIYEMGLLISVGLIFGGVGSLPIFSMMMKADLIVIQQLETGGLMSTTLSRSGC
jgi:hypothetical protein